MLEQLPVVADVIAKSLGVTRGGLRKLGEEGKISAEIVLDAFKGARIELEERFGEAVPTVGQSFTVLRNNVIELVGSLDQASGASAGLAALILFMSENVEVLAVGLLILGLSALPTVIAGTAAWVKQLALARSIAASGALFNPIIAGTAASGAAVLFFVDLYEKSLQRAVRKTKALDDNFREFARGGDLGEIDTAIGNIEKTIARIQDASDQGLIDPKDAAERIAGLTARIDELGQEFLALADGSRRSLAEIRAQAQAADELAEAIQGVSDKFAAENELLGLNSRERNIQIAIARQLAEFEKENGQLIEEDRKRVKALLEEEIRRSQALQEQADVLERITGPQEKFKNDLAALDSLLKDARVSPEQYNSELARMVEQLGLLDAVDPEAILGKLSLPEGSVDRLKELVEQLKAAAAAARDAEPGTGSGVPAGGNLNLNTFVEPPADRFNAATDAATSYSEALQKVQFATDNVAGESLKGLERGFASIINEISDVSGAVEDLTVNAFANLEDAFVSFLTTGEADFSAFVDSLIADIARLIVRLLLLKAIEAIGGGAGAAAGTAAGAVTGAGARGGDFPAGRPIVVGEEGPEIFTPAGGGTVTPAGASAAIIGANTGGGPAAAPVVNVAPPVVTNVFVNDPSEIPSGIESPDGEQAVMNVIRRNSGQVKQMTG